MITEYMGYTLMLIFNQFRTASYFVPAMFRMFRLNILLIYIIKS